MQDIKSQVQKHEEVGSPDKQESKDDKTLDEHTEGEEWLESSESAELSNDSDVRISRNKLYTKEDSNKKINKIFVGVKENHQLLILPFMVKNCLIHFLQKYPHILVLQRTF